MRRNEQARRFAQSGILLGFWFVTCGWWFIRDKLLYGHFFLHTPNPGLIHNGIDAAHRAAKLFGYNYGGYPGTLRFEMQETFLSTWIQRSWLPEVWDIYLYGFLTTLLVVSLAGVIVWLARLRRKPVLPAAESAPPVLAAVAAVGPNGETSAAATTDSALDTGEIAAPSEPAAAPAETVPVAIAAEDGGADVARKLRRVFVPLAIAMVLFEFFGQQIAVWFVDFGWNAGGRYLLQMYPEIMLLVTLGLIAYNRKISTGLLGLWICLIVVMNVISAKNIVDYLVPHYFAGWRMFEFPQGVQVKDFIGR
jgi:hypothetical protein